MRSGKFQTYYFFLKGTFPKTTVWLFFLKMKMTVHVVLHLDEDKGSVRKNEAIENTSIIKISSFLRTDPLIVLFILP